MNKTDKTDKNEQAQSKHLPGFYIALCCCVVAIGVAGYFSERRTSETQSDTIAANEVVTDVGDTDDPADNDNAANDAPVSEIPETADAAETVEPVETAEVVQTVDDTAENGAAEETAVIVGAPSFALPEGASVTVNFTRELAYNDALGDWRTHNGVDIAVESGGSVAAIGDGVIKSVSSDEMGCCVEVEHSGDMVSKYRGMSSVEDLNEGDSVKCGDVLGIVTESRGESMKESHLHLEMYKGGTLVDPSEYL